MGLTETIELCGGFNVELTGFDDGVETDSMVKDNSKDFSLEQLRG
jgi:hypothetical protein